MLAVLLAFAFASTPSELAVERGRVAIEQGEPLRAVELALGALDAPEARELLATAFTASGQGARGLAEIAAVPPLSAPYAPLRAQLGQAVDASDSTAAVAISQSIQDAHPEHPELHAPLWDLRDPSGRLRKHREKLVDQVVAKLAKSPGDPVYAYRVRTVLHAAGRSADPAVQALEALGEPRLARAAPLSLHERRIRAEGIANTGVVSLPDGSLAEVVDVADRAGEKALAEHRADYALAAWQASLGVGANVEAADGQLRALLALKRHQEARDAADQALHLVSDPWPEDVAAIRRDARSAALASLLRDRAAALEGVNQPLDAFRDQKIADLLARTNAASPLESRVRKTGLPAYRALSEGYADPVAEKSIQAAQKALAAGDFTAALAHADAALTFFPWIGGTDWRRDASAMQAIRARALAGSGNGDAARVAWAIALLIDPEAPVDWWVDAAAAHRAAGHREIAFSRYATALQRDPSLDPAPLAADHVGPADPVVASRTVALPAPIAPEEGGARVVRGETQHFDAVSVKAKVVSTAKSPREGDRMVHWTVETDAGAIGSNSLIGRTSVLLFWTADCTSCIQAIHDAGDVARELRRTGRDVAVVAVSLDPEPRAFDELRELQRVRVVLAHSPSLGQKLGVARVPEHWIVDPGGTVRYHAVGWDGRASFERALGRALYE